MGNLGTCGGATVVVRTALYCTTALGSLLLLAGCCGLNALMPDRPLRAMLQRLPEPEPVVLLDEAQGFSYGSDDQCVGAYTYRLYGTELPFANILAFYRDNLPRGEWHEDRRFADPTWTSPTKQFVLSLTSEVDASHFPAQSVERAPVEFPTAYSMSLSYVPDPACRQF